MTTKRDYTNTPEYWSISPATFDAWVDLLGYAAAGKLMAACAAYLLHGTEPDQIKLTKSAASMFEAERAKLDRRRELALKAGKGSRKKVVTDASDQPVTNVENSKSCKEVSEKSAKSCEKSSKKSASEQPKKQPSTSGNANTRLASIISLNRSHNPQTPAPRCSARGSGALSRAEFDALLREGLGYDSPTAYGLSIAKSVVGG
jgi:hypothetical protein